MQLQMDWAGQRTEHSWYDNLILGGKGYCVGYVTSEYIEGEKTGKYEAFSMLPGLRTSRLGGKAFDTIEEAKARAEYAVRHWMRGVGVDVPEDDGAAPEEGA